MKKFKTNLFKRRRDKVLVLSGGGFRWFYSIWVLKWFEERGVDQDIKAIFWVSIGAIIWSLRAYWVTADEIYKILRSVGVNKFYSRDIFKKNGGVLSSHKLEEQLQKLLPVRFGKLKKKMHIWVVDTNTAQYLLLNSGNLQKIVLWSMSIPGLFPPVEYKKHLLVDGGVLNNFPVDLAKNMYPKHKIIGVALNKFEKNQKIKTIMDNIIVNFEIILRSKLLKNTKLVDYLFYRKIPISIISLDKRKMKKAYDIWYEDCLKMFK